MTLKEAYEKWSKEENNKILAMRYRSANNKCFLEKWGTTPLEQVDRKFVFQIFANCKEEKVLKAKAASAIVYVMRYVFDKKLIPSCKPVNYDYNDIMSGQVTDSNSISQKAVKEISEAPAPVYEETGEVKMMSSVTNANDNELNTTPTIKRSHHPKAREVAIINPLTKEIIHRFPSASNAEKTCSVRNIDRYCKKRKPLKGVWWAYVDELEGWEPGIVVETLESSHKMSQKPPRKQKNISVVDRRKQKVTNSNKEENTMNHQEITEEVAAPVVSTEQNHKVFSIEDVTTEELIAECRRRGWTGDFYVHFKL